MRVIICLGIVWLSIYCSLLLMFIEKQVFSLHCFNSLSYTQSLKPSVVSKETKTQKQKELTHALMESTLRLHTFNAAPHGVNSHQLTLSFHQRPSVPPLRLENMLFLTPPLILFTSSQFLLVPVDLFPLPLLLASP